MHLLSIVGIGADGPRGLSADTQALIAQSPVLAGSAEQLRWWPQRIERIEMGCDLAAFFARLEQALAEGPAVLLASGDPLYFGIGRLVIERFGRERVRFLPHLSAVQLACNRAKLPWQEAVVVSAHGRSLEKLGEALRSLPDLVAVLTDPVNTPARLARFVLDLAPVTPYKLWVCSHLGAEDEQVECLGCEQACERDFAEPNVVLLERAPARTPLTLPAVGIHDDHFVTFADRPGLMTKYEVRVLALAYLQLERGQVCWDIGSGTGSVAIEMARLVGGGSVYAIEKTEAGCLLIEANCARLGVCNVRVRRTRAPEGLAELPAPDRIFLGGGGRQLLPILETCTAALRPGGMLVASFAGLEQLVSAQSYLLKQGWAVQYTQLQISRSASLASGSRLVPLNPVFLLRSSQPL
ncbi:MAG: precorrin-6y C5,15-methyltransferase (decarboxylating) subunit CbiE [Aphanocapsa lilacina HA4352-LM1]|jgi:precorrin-6Y C5,15-methyltransferase (decarboxylating)|nr:precorrin-6y C5,15-methyltransferase (decarboxylating) subunit CbiE [Aphanocapsa lilacina HA4352-LM1]